MHSLVEHLKKRKENTIKDGGDLRTSFSLPDLNEIITALSPPMPDDVLRVINALIYDDSGVDAAINMLERLQRENSQLREACGNNQQSIVKVRNHYQQHIAEQQSRLEVLYDGIESTPAIVKISRLEQRIAELEADSVHGWRSCIDHIIRPDSPCPVCRIAELVKVVDR